MLQDCTAAGMGAMGGKGSLISSTLKATATQKRVIHDTKQHKIEFTVSFGRSCPWSPGSRAQGRRVLGLWR